MADPYSQAANIAAPFARLGSQMFQGQALYEQGRAKSALQEAQRSAMESHSGLYNAQAQKAQEEAAGLAQRRQYQTPEFASQIAATLNGLSPEQGAELASGNAPWASPEQIQSFNRGRGAHLAQLGATGDTNGEQMIKAFGELLGQGRQQEAVRTGNFNTVNALGAADKGKLYDSTPRGILNAGTGQESVNADWQKVQRSSAAENYAQANNANASASQHIASRDLTRSKIGESQTVTMPDGTVVSTGAPMPKLTEIQAKSQLFGSRAAEADRLISELEGKYSPAAINAKMGVEGIWGVGGALGAAGNVMLSKDGQMAEQAQRDFINAILRLESGAVIGADEFDNAKKQYFPQPGDSKEVLKQKSANRRTAIEGLKVMAGPASGLVNYGGKEQPKEKSSPPVKPPVQDKTALLRDAKEAISRGANRAEVIKELKRLGVDGGSI